MDKLVFPSILIRNVSYNISPENLASAIVSLFKKSEIAVKLDSSQIYIFQENGNRIAVIRGLNQTFGEIKRTLALQKIDRCDILVAHDFDYPRHADGQFVSPLSGGDKQLLECLFMHPQGNIHSFFVPDLAKEIEKGNFSNRATMKNIRNVRDRRLIQSPGRVLAYRLNSRQNEFVVEYFTLLEKLQALCLLNGNTSFAEIGNFNNCIIRRKCGLGAKGILKVEDVEKKEGYIPFEAFNQNLILKPKEKALFNKCYNCEHKGCIELLGVTSCLKFYVGKCNICDYTKNDPLLPKSAVRFQNEDFSRVLMGRNDLQLYQGDATALNLVLTPFKLVYTSSQEARNIMCNIVENETWTSSELFTLANTTQGQMVGREQFIEVINPEALENQESYYLLTIRVPKTKAWSPEGIQMFHHVTIRFYWRPRFHARAKLEPATRTAKIVAIDVDGNEQVLVKFRIRMNRHTKFDRETMMTLRPYSPKHEYETLCNVMKDWVAKSRQYKFQLLENILIRGSSGSFDLEDHTIDKENLLLLGQLNKCQVEAVQRCQKGRISVVQGPPGTGKTLTAAVTVLEIARTESGLIICVAKSNEAANNLCNAIAKKLALHRDSKVKEEKGRYENIRVARMTSVKKQNDFFRTVSQENNNAPNNNFRFLHEDIAAHKTFRNDPDLTKLFKKIARSGMDKLTDAESGQFDFHITEIQNLVLDDVRILVTTLASLTDKRIPDYLPNRKKKCEEGEILLNTIMLDEAGVVPMPMAVPMLAFPAKRFLFFGDQEQLPPLVTSTSAGTAGFGMSIMKFLELGIVRNCPAIWKTLNVQYRMNPGICTIVSNMTYKGSLVCGDIIKTRLHHDNVIKLRAMVKNAIPATRESDVVVFQHNYKEKSNDARSKLNRGEARIIKRIAEKLTKAGVCQSLITIITPYDAQRSHLLERLAENHMTRNIAVVNVDAYQGRENEIIILSFVRSNDKNEIGFCQMQNRLNVMISRARQFQFFVGNIDMITIEKKEDGFMKHIREGLAKVPRPKF